MHVPGKPDGLAVGPDDGVWVAMWGGGRVVRVERSGQISRQIPVPATQVSSCCFMPDAPDTLYVSTSRLRLTPEEICEAPWSGSLLAIDI
jgi:sugar lactone lactonase YvrE